MILQNRIVQCSRDTSDTCVCDEHSTPLRLLLTEAEVHILVEMRDYNATDKMKMRGRDGKVFVIESSFNFSSLTRTRTPHHN